MNQNATGENNELKDDINDEIYQVLAQILIDEDQGIPVDRFKLLQRHPAHRERLMEYFEAVESVESMAGPTYETFAGQIDKTSVEATPKSADGAPPEPNQVFGRYLIQKTLGKGGMGTVYLAEDTVLNRKVALKVPRFPEDQSDMVERFHREAKAAAVIQHRNICPVFDIGKHEGQLYITMAFIEGKPLSDFIKSKKLPKPTAVAKTIRKLALALNEAHSLGIVHRDLKPANIMIDQKREPVLMDFGLARQESLTESNQLTQSGMIVGTPAYMSPEQVRSSGKVGPSADIYSLGIIMYQMLTGDLPFRGDIVSVITKIVIEDPPAPSTIRSDVHPRLEEICLKAIEKNPDSRFQSMEEFAKYLTDFIKDPEAKVSGFDVEDPSQDESEDAICPEESFNNESDSYDANNPDRDNNASDVIDSFFRQPESGTNTETKVGQNQNTVNPMGSIAPNTIREKPTKNPPVEPPVAPPVASPVKIDVGDAKPLRNPNRRRNKEVATEKSPKKTVQAAGQFPKWPIIGGVATAFVAIAIALSIILLIPTKDGVIRVEIDDPSINVVVNSNGFTINGDDKSHSIKVEPGVEQSLKITRGDFVFETDKFALRKGEKAIVKIELVKGEIVALRDGQQLKLIPDDRNPDKTKLATNTPTGGGNESATAVVARLISQGAEFETEADVHNRQNSNRIWAKVSNQVKFANLTKVKVIDDQDLAVLIETFPNLTDLTIDLSTVSAAGLEPLRNSRLTRLIGRHPKESITDEQAKMIGQIGSLMELRIQNCGVQDEQLKYFANCKKLIFMDIRGYKILGPGIRYLHELPNLIELWLDMSRPVDAAYVERVAKMEQLEGLQIRVDADTDLSSMARLKNLKRLEIWSQHPVKDLTPLANLPLESIRINHDVSRHLQVLRSIKTLNRVNDQPIADVLAKASPSTNRAGIYQRLKEIKVEVICRPKNRAEYKVGLDDNWSKLQTEPCSIFVPYSYRLTNAEFEGLLDAFPNLIVLAFDITKVSPENLAKLAKTQIEHLAITANKTNENHLAGIGEIEQLKVLDLYSYPKVSDEQLRHFSNLKNLKSLNLNGNTISGRGIKYLLGMKELAALFLESTSESRLDSDGIRGISEFNKLIDLSLTVSSDADLEPLAKLKMLGKLSIHSNEPIKDLSPIEDLPLHTILLNYDDSLHRETVLGMKTLSMINEQPKAEFLKTKIADSEKGDFFNRISNMSILFGQYGQEYFSRDVDIEKNKERVEVIRIDEQSDFNDEDLRRALKEFPNLKVLLLAKTQVTIDGIALLKDKRLEILGLDQKFATADKLAKVAELDKVKELQFFHADINDKSLKQIAKMRELYVLSVVRCRVKGPGLKDLEGLAQLIRINLSNNPVSSDNLTSLGLLPSLTELELKGCKNVDDLSGLEKLRLQGLDIRGTSVTDISPLSGLPLHKIDLDYDPRRHRKTLESIKTLEWINGKRKDDFLNSRVP